MLIFYANTAFARFCKDTAKVSCLPFLKITTKSTHSLPAKKKIPTLWIELRKVSKRYI